MDQSYWHKQEPDKLFFPDIEWNKPERCDARGKLLIVGGSAHSIAGMNKAYTAAREAGAGTIRLALPDTFKKTLPGDIDGIFLPTNNSGGVSRDGLNDLSAAVNWADSILFVGDSGQNSETAMVFEKLLNDADNEKWFTITRDAIDLLYGMGETLVNRPHTNLVMSFAQAQKLFSIVYYPKILTHSMQLASFVDAVHKFSITYRAVLTVLHNNQILVAHDGEVVSQNDVNPMSLVDGSFAARGATYLIWTPQQPLAAIATSWQG